MDKSLHFTVEVAEVAEVAVPDAQVREDFQ